MKVLRVPGFTKGRVKLSAHSLSGVGWGGGGDNVSFCCGGFVVGGCICTCWSRATVIRDPNCLSSLLFVHSKATWLICGDLENGFYPCSLVLVSFSHIAFIYFFTCYIITSICIYIFTDSECS